NRHTAARCQSRAGATQKVGAHRSVEVMQKIRHQHEIVTLAPGYLKGTAHDCVVSILHPGGGRVLPRNRNHCPPIEARYVALRKASTESDAKETVACGDI